jgi:predicted 3-demethylubiquinone-9 3-methyltransferase (glyoxalase superfamily)
METTQQKITPFLWFNGHVEEAVNFYTSVFRQAKVTNMRRMGDKVFTATFQLEGQEFMALDGGPHFDTFSPAISFFVKCKTQEEVDYYWNKLTDGGSEQPCGWLKDRFGISWQIIPDALGQLMGDPNPAKSKHVMDAMMKMKKIIIRDLEEAHRQA